MDVDPKDIEQFTTNLSVIVGQAMQAGVPLENIVLALDLKHHEVLSIRHVIMLKRAANEAAKGIIPASKLPSN